MERYSNLDRLGYRHVQYEFVQPPLEESKRPSKSLLLCVSVKPPHKLLKAPEDPMKFKLPVQLLKEWMVEYWGSVDTSVESLPEYHEMMSFFEDHKGEALQLKSLLDLFLQKSKM